MGVRPRAAVCLRGTREMRWFRPETKRNGFGGYTRGQAVLTVKNKVVVDSAAAWNASCRQLGYSELEEVEIAAGWRGLFGGEKY
jgi:hypothetical protein